MKVLLTGATGAIGRPLVPRLTQRGHHVIAAVRSEASGDAARTLGAEAVQVDLLDPDDVTRVVRTTKPEAIIHQATQIPDALDLRRLDGAFEATNRLRTAATDHLVAAARAHDVPRVIAQGFVGWTYEPTGTAVKDEDAPLLARAPAGADRTLAALLHLERVVLETDGMEGTVLRYGNFYGPGTGIAPGAAIPGLVRRRRLPVVGTGQGVWSFVHIDDAAAATVAALETGRRGVYNIADDDPAPVATWLPAMAGMLGVRGPPRVPVFIGRLAIGRLGLHMMTTNRGATNQRAKTALGWTPRFPSWRDGFRAVLASTPASTVRAKPTAG